MKPKTIILMVVAIACGLGASYGTTRLIANRRKPAQVKTVPVVYAKTTVPKFKPLEKPEEFFVVRQVAEKNAPRSRFASLKELKNRQLRQPLSKDQHLAKENLLDKSQHPLTPPKGYGALSINVTQAAIAGGFLRPGDWVNVLWTSGGRGGKTKGDSQALLKQVLVLASGTMTEEKIDDGTQTIESSTVTMALKTNESRLLFTAETEGEIRLHLINPESNVEVADREDLTEEELKKMISELRGIKSQPSVASPNQPVVPVGPPIPADGDTQTTKKPKAEIIKPVHSFTISSGSESPRRVYFYRDEQGRVTAEKVPFKRKGEPVKKEEGDKAKSKSRITRKSAPKKQDDDTGSNGSSSQEADPDTKS